VKILDEETLPFDDVDQPVYSDQQHVLASDDLDLGLALEYTSFFWYTT
jgi:hypothetical protein